MSNLIEVAEFLHPPPPFKLINLDPSLPEEAENKKIQISFGFAANKINRN